MAQVASASMLDRSQRPWFQQHPRLALTVAAALCAGIFLLRVFVEGAEDPVSTLFVLPVALVALSFGFRAGAAAGLVAVGLLAVWVVEAGVTLSPLGWVSRITPLLLLGTLVGFSSDRIRDADRAERYAAAVALLQVEGAEISDRIFQGLAASKWMLEVGEIERGLAAMEDTMVMAQQLVTGVLGSNSVLRDDIHRAHVVIPASTEDPRPSE